MVATLALALVLLSVQLSNHADNRRDTMEQVAALKISVADQHTFVWRALARVMAGETVPLELAHARMQRYGREIRHGVAALGKLDEAGQAWSTRLGLAPAPAMLDAVRNASERFLASADATMAATASGVDHVHHPLDRWDVHYRELESALDAMRWQDVEIAEISAQVADRVTAVAVLTCLVAALLFAGALARERQNEQMRTMAISESRFRGLVQHSSDLILVMEPHGTIRYATPSAQALMTESYGSSAGERGGQNWPNHAGAKALHVEQLLGLSVAELLQRERNEVELRDANGKPCIYEFRVTDLTYHADIGGIVINGRDITAAKAAEERLRHQATHDPVTWISTGSSWSTTRTDIRSVTSFWFTLPHE